MITSTGRCRRRNISWGLPQAKNYRQLITAAREGLHVTVTIKEKEALKCKGGNTDNPGRD